MSTWNCNVWRKGGIHVPDQTEFLNTTIIWLPSLHNTDSLGYTFQLCSLHKYGWTEDEPVTGGDSTKGHIFHTLLRSFLPLYRFMHGFTSLRSKHLTRWYLQSTRFERQLPAPMGDENTYSHVNKKQKCILSVYEGCCIERRWV